jgi:hypothetical protein
MSNYFEKGMIMLLQLVDSRVRLIWMRTLKVMRKIKQQVKQMNCGNGRLHLNVGCENTSSQIEGDDNVVGKSF